MEKLNSQSPHLVIYDDYSFSVKYYKYSDIYKCEFNKIKFIKWNVTIFFF